MEKSWLKSYPKGVPHEVDVFEYSSVCHVLEKSCAKFGATSAFYCMGTTLSFDDIDRLSRDFAAYLQKTAGLQKGDRVAVQLPNILQYPVALFGILRAGGVVVNTNPLYTPREMEHQFKDSGAKAVIILANFAHNLEEIIENTAIQTVIVTEVGDMLHFPKNFIVNAALRYLKKAVPAYKLPGSIGFKDAVIQGAAQTLEEPELKHGDLAFLQYTGGTTGVAKGAMLTHGNVVANLQQISAWMRPFVPEGSSVVITPLPMYHIFSLTVNCLTFMKFGGRNVLITNPRDMGAFIKEMSKFRFDVITGVNTLFNGLMNHPDFAKLDFSSLKIAVGGAMAVQSAVAEKWKKITGQTLVEGYGLTEASPVLTCNPIDGSARISSIGLPIPLTEIRLVKDDGSDAPRGESGEIWARGPQVMPGYWQRPDETKKVLTDDGWLQTGDVGVVDEKGYFKIVDRKKDMILVSGFNVYPNEVEDVVATHPGVLEVAAVGVTDEKSGEAVKIFVVKKDPNLSSEELKKFCYEKLTGYKVPKFIEFRTDLPKTNVGKILRRALRETPAAK